LKSKVANLSRITDELATAKARCAAREAAMADEMDVAMLKILAAQLAKFEAQAADLEAVREAVALTAVESFISKKVSPPSSSSAATKSIRLHRGEIRVVRFFQEKSRHTRRQNHGGGHKLY
jgi:hypothetical protein